MACTYLTILPDGGLDLSRTLLCGQAFRWRKTDGGFTGVAGNRPLCVSQEGGELRLSCAEQELGFWSHYFALDRDYSQLEELLACDPETSPCLPYSRGIRILRQEPFETLISFILSANNNFSRISGIVERICEAYGEAIPFEGATVHAFPSPQAIAGASPQELSALGAGYRSPFLVKSARRVAYGYDLAALQKLPYAAAKQELLAFEGVGPKVADCILLFSLGFDEAFPVDVWVARVVEYLYPGEDGRKAARRAAERFDTWAGPAQQYLFHYARQVGLGKQAGPRKKTGEEPA